MSLVWGVLEEVLRLMEMHSGGGTSASASAGGERVNGDGGSEYTDEGEDAFSEDEVCREQSYAATHASHNGL